MISRLCRFIYHLRRFPRPLASLTLILAALSFSIAWGAGSLEPDQSGAPPLFHDTPDTLPGENLTSSPPSIATQRERLVQVDLALLTDPQRNQALQLNLFEDVIITAEQTKAGPAYDEGFVWVGQVPEKPFSISLILGIAECLVTRMASLVATTTISSSPIVATNWLV